MKLDNLSREEAIELVGLEAVEKVESLNCECTNSPRVTDSDYDEWVAVLDIEHENYRYLTAVYYQKTEDTTVKDDGEDIDLGALTWIVDHYEVV